MKKSILSLKNITLKMILDAIWINWNNMALWVSEIQRLSFSSYHCKVVGLKF